MSRVCGGGIGLLCVECRPGGVLRIELACGSGVIGFVIGRCGQGCVGSVSLCAMWQGRRALFVRLGCSRQVVPIGACRGQGRALCVRRWRAPVRGIAVPVGHHTRHFSSDDNAHAPACIKPTTGVCVGDGKVCCNRMAQRRPSPLDDASTANASQRARRWDMRMWIPTRNDVRLLMANAGEWHSSS